MNQRGRMFTRAGIALGVLGTAMWILWAQAPFTPTYQTSDEQEAAAGNPARTLRTTGSASVRPDAPDSPFATQTTIQGDLNPAPAAESAADRTAGAGVAVGALTPAMIGQRGWSEEAYQQLLNRVRKDPALFARLLDEFSASNDPERLRRLGMLLVDAGGARMTSTAADMVNRGDKAARDAGLQVLGRLQGDDEEARSVLTGLLAAPVDDDMLIATLRALPAAPAGDNALLEQVLPLAQHGSASVRATSVAWVARVSDAPTRSSVLEAALADHSATVRKAAVWSAAGNGSLGGPMRQSLFALVENAEETPQVREGAFMALQRATLTDSETQRLAAAQTALTAVDPATPTRP